MKRARLSARRLAAPAGRRAAWVGAAVLFRAGLFFLATFSFDAARARAVEPEALPALSPIVAASVTPAAGNPSDSKAGALPRQFSVEVGPGGVLVADGTRLGAATELDRWAQRALTAARFSGAVVFGDEARDGATIGDVVERLRRAGFSEVRRVGRAAPVELSALAKAAPPVVAERRVPVASPPVASAPSPTTPAPSTRASAAPQRAPAVTLATVGLHVDGLLDREPHRTRLVRVFEREFNTFRRCHERAERHAEGASYGVDLLIPKGGGRGKVRQSRTRLTSKAFRTCMQSAFEAIRFAPPPSERPEIVSYSVLFKPNAR